MSTPRRRYDSTRRRERAGETRALVLRYAHDLFVERGYAGATMTAIAEAAGVSVKTIEANFGTKAQLLKVLVDETVAGDDTPVPIADRPLVQQIIEAPDLDRALELYGELVVTINARLANLAPIIDQAATDPEISALKQALEQNRLVGATLATDTLRQKGSPRPGLTTTQLVDIVYLLGGPAAYRTLVHERSWDDAAFAAWFTRSIRDLFE